MTLDLKINFPNLSEHQLTQLRSLLPFYQEWNEKNKSYFPQGHGAFYATPCDPQSIPY